MPKIKRKFILIGIVSIVVVVLVAVFAVPAMAAGGFSWGPRGGGNTNVTRVQGTIYSLSSTEIQITTTGNSSAANTVTLALDANTNFNIHGNGWFDSGSLTGDSVTAVYANNQTVTPPVASQVMINMPSSPAFTPGATPNHNFASVQGTLSVSGTSPYPITITPNTVPPVALTVPANSTATILYNSNSGAIQRIMMNRSGQTNTTPTNLPNNTAVVQGTLAVSSTSPYPITITPNTTPFVALTVPENPTAAILYNSNSGAVQNLMVGGPGQFGGGPMSMPNPNFNTIQGTMSVATGDVLTITPTTTPSVTLTAPTNATVTILYDSNDIIQGLILGGMGQFGGPMQFGGPRGMPMPIPNFTTIQGTLSVGTGDILTITPTTTPSVTLTAPSNATVTIAYNSNDVIQGLMLRGAGQFGGGLRGMPMPYPNGMNQPGNGRFGRFGPM